MRKLAARVIGIGAVALAISVLAPAAQAVDYVRLDAAGIEQTVLRAQPPTTLGAWRQNYYFGGAFDTRQSSGPGVCSASTGARVSLPKARTGGLVGYEIKNTAKTGKNLGITLYQYANQADADAALAAMRAALEKGKCPDKTKVRTDVGSVVKGQQATDFTDASNTAVESVVRYRYNGGAGMTTVVETHIITQRGLAVIDTSVMLSGAATSTKTVDRAMAMNRSWNAEAVQAYEAFGSGGSA